MVPVPGIDARLAANESLTTTRVDDGGGSSTTPDRCCIAVRRLVADEPPVVGRDVDWLHYSWWSSTHPACRGFGPVFQQSEASLESAAHQPQSHCRMPNHQHHVCTAVVLLCSWDVLAEFSVQRTTCGCQPAKI